MKTVTEFAFVTLKNAIQQADELTAGGKTSEELPAALGEALKVEGDKLKILMNAMDVARSRKEGVRRIVVMSAAEGETVPSGLEKKDDHYFKTEFFPSAASAQKPRGGDRDDDRGRGKKRGGGRGGKRGDRGGDRRGGRPEGGGEGRAAGERGPGGGGGGESRGGRRPPRGPRPDQPVSTTRIVKPLAVPKDQPAPAPEAAPAQTETTTEQS